MAKIEAGKMELHFSDVSLERFIYFIAEAMRVKATEKGLAFACEMAPDLPAGVRVDEMRLRQVLLNLLSNAIRFTEQGSVRLSVAFISPARLRFDVHDTGIGIKEERLETIFRPFEQVSDARYHSGGTGLGLAISSQLLHLMGSEIRAESRFGSGSVFSFELDIQVVVPGAVAGAQRTVRGYKGPRRTILVVDDVAENRAVLLDMLGPLGFEMAEATNGFQALERIEALHPALVLMDVVMPGMDGLEAVRRLRQTLDFKDLPVIAVSAGASRTDATQSLKAGANAFLAKPIDLNGLLSQVASLINVEWSYEAIEESGGSGGPAVPAVTSTGTWVTPPTQEIEALLYLARLGDMRAIVQDAARVIALDERYRPFTDHLCRLAKAYQSKTIVSFLEQYLERN
jgi:CheY-like chemotaxis protein